MAITPVSQLLMTRFDYLTPSNMCFKLNNSLSTMQKTTNELQKLHFKIIQTTKFESK